MFLAENGCGEAPSVGFADTSPMKGEEAGYSSPFMGEVARRAGGGLLT